MECSHPFTNFAQLAKVQYTRDETTRIVSSTTQRTGFAQTEQEVTVEDEEKDDTMYRYLNEDDPWFFGDKSQTCGPSADQQGGGQCSQQALKPNVQKGRQPLKQNLPRNYDKEGRTSLWPWIVIIIAIIMVVALCFLN